MFLSKLLILSKIKYVLIFLCFFGCTSISWALEFSYDGYDDEPALRKSMLMHSDSLYTPNKRVRTYGPVKKNEVIWNIAYRVRPNESISIVHMIVALFKHNPDAFHNNNLNSLLSGVTLIVPDIRQINQLSETEADKIFLNHKQQWQQKRTVTSELPMETEADKELKQVADLIKAIKANNQMMSDNQKKLAKQEAMMGSIDGLLDNIETQIPNNKTQTSKEMEDSSQIKILPQTINEATKSVIEVKNDNKPERSGASTQVDSSQIKKLPQTINEVTKSVIEVKKDNKPEHSGASTHKKINSFHNNAKTDQISGLNTQSDRLNINVEERLINPQNLIILMLIIFVLFFIFKRFKFNLMKEDAPLFQKEIEESELIDKLKLIDELELIEDVDYVDINKFLGKREQLTQNSHRNPRLSTIENIFQINSFTDDNKNRSTENKDCLIIESVPHNTFESEPSFKSIDETPKTPMGNAFFIATHPKKLIYEIMANEFEQVKCNENINVFIENFEEIIPKLTKQTQNMSNGKFGLKALQEFKLLLKSIIKLSDMIQATHLKYLTQMVFVFLDDVLNGNIKMSEKIFKRLLLVVAFYKRYMCSIEINQHYKTSFTNRNLK